MLIMQCFLHGNDDDLLFILLALRHLFLLQRIPQGRVQGAHVQPQGATVEDGHSHLSIQSIQQSGLSTWV